jgi:outer membrane protein TolC
MCWGSYAWCELRCIRARYRRSDGHATGRAYDQAGGARQEDPHRPAGWPSMLLERRPDIAAAERRVAAKSTLIGVAVAAYFSDITLSGFYGWIARNSFRSLLLMRCSR